MQDVRHKHTDTTPMSNEPVPTLSHLTRCIHRFLSISALSAGLLTCYTGCKEGEKSAPQDAKPQARDVHSIIARAPSVLEISPASEYTAIPDNVELSIATDQKYRIREQVCVAAASAYRPYLSNRQLSPDQVAGLREAASEYVLPSELGDTITLGKIVDVQFVEYCHYGRTDSNSSQSVGIVNKVVLRDGSPVIHQEYVSDERNALPEGCIGRVTLIVTIDSKPELHQHYVTNNENGLKIALF